jgi:glucosamine 6-phosphate synthetase-like amidotransferase/phosphosugar isomerase protein
MCGVFAYVAGPDLPDADLFTLAVKGAARRGPDSHGWWSVGGAIHKELGPLDPATVPRRPIILGHARLATMGAHGIEGAQPIVTKGGHVMVHNGNVTNWLELDDNPVTDSYALASLYDQIRSTGMEPVEALEATLTASEQVAYAVVLLDADGTLLASHSGLPLHCLTDDTGTYVSSGKLPGSSPLAENQSLDLGNTRRSHNGR